MSEGAGIDLAGFAVAFGAVYGAMLLFIGWAAWLTGYGTEYVDLAGSLIPGFGATAFGGLLGAAGGLVLGLAMGAAIAWIHNAVAAR